jgi:hypothetical protein
MVKAFLTGCIVAFLPWFMAARGQVDFPNETKVYAPTIKTVLLHKAGFEMSAPVIRLNSTEKLELSFDDLREDPQQFQFTIRHCGTDWSTTPDMLPSGYITGFAEDEIVQTENSFNTTVPYTHYSVTFPTRDMQPRISGNFLLIVYSSDPAQPDLTCRFMVVEPSTVSVEAEVTQSDRMEERFTSQQVNFKVNMAGFPLMDPKREVKVVILQNDRWDNALYVGAPRFVRGNELDYYYDERNTFEGANEFRGFDLKSLRYQSMRIRRIQWDNSWQVWLLDDVNRSAKNYVTDPDINGRMMIKSDDNAVRSELESDYAWVHFAFPSGPLPQGTRLYVMGALTNWRMGEENELAYNPVTRKYELALYLKQGYYNYIYVTRQTGSNAGDASFAEGNHWETENQYMILVYLHELGGLYDRLIAVQDVNSHQRN